MTESQAAEAAPQPREPQRSVRRHPASALRTGPSARPGHLLAWRPSSSPGRLALNLTTAIPGDGFDGWQNYWNQWWIKQALVDRLANPLFTDMLYHPTGVSLYFHTLNPFNGITTLPVQLAFGLIPAYNAVVLLSWVLAGYGMFLLTRWVMGDRRHRPAAADRRHASPATSRPSGRTGLHALALPHGAPARPHAGHEPGVDALLRAVHCCAACTRRGNGRPWLRSAAVGGALSHLHRPVRLVFRALSLPLHRRGDRSGCGWPRRDARRCAGCCGSRRRRRWRAASLPWRSASGSCPWCVEALRFRFMVRPSADLYILSASVMDFLVPNRLHTLFRPGELHLDRQPDRTGERAHDRHRLCRAGAGRRRVRAGTAQGVFLVGDGDLLLRAGARTAVALWQHHHGTTSLPPHCKARK